MPRSIGAATGTQATSGSNGIAALTLSGAALASGVYALTVTYTPSGNFTGSTAATAVTLVEPEPTSP